MSGTWGLIWKVPLGKAWEDTSMGGRYSTLEALLASLAQDIGSVAWMRECQYCNSDARHDGLMRVYSPD